MRSTNATCSHRATRCATIRPSSRARSSTWRIGAPARAPDSCPGKASRSTLTARPRRGPRDGGIVTLIIGLAGGTGAGKSSIVRGLVERIGGCVIDLESYTLDRSACSPEERSAIGDEEPAAIDTPLLATHLVDLRRGEAIRRPVYSPEKHARTGAARSEE